MPTDETAASAAIRILTEPLSLEHIRALIEDVTSIWYHTSAYCPEYNKEGEQIFFYIKAGDFFLMHPNVLPKFIELNETQLQKTPQKIDWKNLKTQRPAMPNSERFAIELLEHLGVPRTKK